MRILQICSIALLTAQAFELKARQSEILVELNELSKTAKLIEKNGDLPEGVSMERLDKRGDKLMAEFDQLEQLMKDREAAPVKAETIEVVEEVEPPVEEMSEEVVVPEAVEELGDTEPEVPEALQESAELESVAEPE